MGSGTPGLDDSRDSSASWSLLSRSTEKRIGGGGGLGTARFKTRMCKVPCLYPLGIGEEPGSPPRESVPCWTSRPSPDTALGSPLLMASLLSSSVLPQAPLE